MKPLIFCITGILVGVAIILDYPPIWSAAVVGAFFSFDLIINGDKP